MDTRDILAIVIAFALVAALAVAVPLLRGAEPEDTQATPTQAVIWDTGRPTPHETPSLPTGTAPTVETTRIPWDQTPVTIGFVNGGETVTLTTPPTVAPLTMITYATINGEASGTTQTFDIPFPYWQLEYTASPSALPPDVFPRIIIQVFDAGNPNRPVRVMNQDVYTEEQELPWVENFYEGNRSYYFGVTTRFIDSYTLTIKVPSTYV
jgi:hypothetical protein